MSNLFVISASEVLKKYSKRANTLFHTGMREADRRRILNSQPAKGEAGWTVQLSWGWRFAVTPAVQCEKYILIEIGCGAFGAALPKYIFINRVSI